MTSAAISIGMPAISRRVDRRRKCAVTSPGGTTAAGLEVLGGSPGLAGLLRDAVAAAQRRSRALGTAG